MEGLCKIWATAIIEQTRVISQCPKMLHDRVNGILEELKEAGE